MKFNYDFSNDGASEKYAGITDVFEKTFLDVAVMNAYEWEKDDVFKRGAEYSQKCLKDFSKKDIPDPDSGSCIFRKNRALAPHERSAVPLGTDHCPVG